MKDVLMEKNASFYNLEAEQQLIGAVIMVNSAYHNCSDLISGEHFYYPLHREIWEVCSRRISAGDLITPVVLKSLLANSEFLEQSGGPSYLARISASAISARAVRDYAKVISGLWQRRTVMEALNSAQEAIVEGGEVSEGLKVIMAVSDALSVSDGRPSSISYIAALVEAVGELHDAANNGSAGVRTGITDLDNLTGPFRKGDMIVIGGVPSMGKTSLALGIAHAAADLGVGIALVSLEMTGQSLAFRAIGAESGVEYERIISGELDEDEGRLVQEAIGKIQNRPIEIVQPHIKDLHAINAAILRIKAQLEARGYALGLILIDYLQLVRAPGKDRYSVVSAASSGIKGIAMQVGCPVIALAQLSRAVMDRDDKRPRLSDLRESGQIEQDADFVLFVHREEYYLQRERPLSSSKSLGTQYSKERETGKLADHEAALSACKNKMEVICAKKRMGRIGTVVLGCDVATNQIWSLSEDKRQERLL